MQDRGGAALAEVQAALASASTVAERAVRRHSELVEATEDSTEVTARVKRMRREQHSAQAFGVATQLTRDLVNQLQAAGIFCAPSASSSSASTSASSSTANELPPLETCTVCSAGLVCPSQPELTGGVRLGCACAVNGERGAGLLCGICCRKTSVTLPRLWHVRRGARGSGDRWAVTVDDPKDIPVDYRALWFGRVWCVLGRG